MGLLSVLLLIFMPWHVSEPGRGMLLTIPRGTSPRQISHLLRQHGIVRSEIGFLASARLLGWTTSLKAGRYRFNEWENHYSVLRTLVNGLAVLEKITLPEGIRASKIAGLVANRLAVDSVFVMRIINDSDFCTRMRVEAGSLEGYLYPDTYLFQSNDGAELFLKRMVERFHNVFSDSLREIARQHGWTVHEVVTLASIVEGEAVVDSERPIISAIYINRLRRGYPLQACPTVQYLLPGPPRRLLEKDLKIQSPYNTYLHTGLPPGPVNNPGLRSILAVLHPVPVDYLYLVANGDGTHTFSRTLDEHNAAKRRFEHVRRNTVNSHQSWTSTP